MESVLSMNSLFCAGGQLPSAFFHKSAMVSKNPAENINLNTPSFGASGGAPATNVTKPESEGSTKPAYSATVKKASEGNVSQMDPQCSSYGAAAAGPSVKGQDVGKEDHDLADELEHRFGRAMELNSPMKRVGHVFDLHSMIQDVSDSDDDEFSDSSSEEERGGLPTIPEEDEEEEEEGMF